MTFSQSSACSFVPLMARIVLGLAFISAGFAHLFRDGEFTQEQIDTLERTTIAQADPGFRIVPASLNHLVQDGDPAPAGGGTGETVDDDPQDSNQDSDQDAGEDDVETDDDGEDGGGGIVDPTAPGPPRYVTAKSLNNIALNLHENGFGDFFIDPVTMAWTVSVVELIGGVLILIGLFTRAWALALAVIMGFAFYTTTFTGTEGLGAEQMRYVIVENGLHHANFNHLFTQVALFALAFGVFLTGAGPISLDRMLFKGGRDQEIDVDLT